MSGDMATSWFSLAIAALVGLAVGCLGMLMMSLSIDGPVDREKKLQADLKECQVKLTEAEAAKTRNAEQFAAEQAAVTQQITAEIEKAELNRIQLVVLQKQIESGEAIDVHKESKWVGPKFRETSRWYGVGPKSVGSVRKDGSAIQIRWTVIGDRGELLVYRQTIPDQPWETFSSTGGVETHYLHAPAGHYLLQLNGEFQEWEIVVSIQSKES